MEFSAISPITLALPMSDPASPDGIIIRPVDQNTIQALATLNSLVLPVSYPKRFYTQLLSSKTSQSHLAFHPSAAFGRPVGAICTDSSIPVEPCVREFEKEVLQVHPEIARTLEDKDADKDGGGFLWTYIQTLCVLAPFRRLGIAGSLIEEVLQHVSEPVVGLWAHVHSADEDAIQWYEKRGFRRLERIEGYYRKLVPNSAWIMVRITVRQKKEEEPTRPIMEFVIES